MPIPCRLRHPTRSPRSPARDVLTDQWYESTSNDTRFSGRATEEDSVLSDPADCARGAPGCPQNRAWAAFAKGTAPDTLPPPGPDAATCAHHYAPVNLMLETSWGEARRLHQLGGLVYGLSSGGVTTGQDHFPGRLPAQPFPSRPRLVAAYCDGSEPAVRVGVRGGSDREGVMIHPLRDRGLAFTLLLFLFTSVAIVFSGVFLYNYSISKQRVEKQASRAMLSRHAEWMRRYPSTRILIEGQTRALVPNRLS